MVITAHNIEQKPGYKQTEIGWLPEDWEVKMIGEVAPLQRGFDLPTYQLKMGSYPVVYSNGILNYHSDFRVNAPGVVTGRSGTIGKVQYIENDYWPHNTSLWVTNFKGSLPKFIYYLFVYINLEQFRTGSGVPTLNRNDVHTYQIPLPPLPEQQAIAAALGDVDALIASLDALIAKKRDIKHATMQQLLTGKTRLPGFSGAWHSFNMADNSTLKARIGWQGLTTTEYLKEGEYYLVTGTDFVDGKIDWDTCHFVDAKRYVQDKNIQLRVDDILLTKDGTIGKAAYVDYLPNLTTLNSGVFVIRPNSDRFYARYLYYVLRSSIFNSFLNQLKAGSTISHLYQKDFVSFNFLLPSLEEQKSIVTILSDMDAEIALVEQRRDKTRALKQAMMQELLTGKTRLR